MLSGEDAEGAEASGEEGTNAEKKVKKDKKKDSAKTSGGEEEDQLNNKASPAPGIKEKKSKKVGFILVNQFHLNIHLRAHVVLMTLLPRFGTLLSLLAT